MVTVVEALALDFSIYLPTELPATVRTNTDPDWRTHRPSAHNRSNATRDISRRSSTVKYGQLLPRECR